MLAPNTLLQNRYLIVRQLGQGGMGAVYEATDQRFGSTVALKQTLVRDEQLKKAFEREARLLNRLRHPALPVVIDYFEEVDGEFLVMDYVPGEDMAGMLVKRGAPFPLDEVLRWADQLLDALAYLHSHEPPIVHRDIKPQNVKLTLRGDVILLDFGLAKGSITGMSVAQGSIFGYTPQYAPFEQMRGVGTDPRSDLYSCAATLYALLTGTAPPDGMQRAASVLSGEPDPLRSVAELNPLVPTGVSEVIRWAMSQYPEQRPKSAAEMREALRTGKVTGPVLADTIVNPAGADAGATVITPDAKAPSLKTFEFDTVTVDARGTIVGESSGTARSFVEQLGPARLEMVHVPAGSFVMGSLAAEAGRQDREGPRHGVTVPAFYLARYPVTQAQWRAVAALPKVTRELDADPAFIKGDDWPVESVSWHDATEFCARLARATGRAYRLPSEAEWEYACRAGASTPFHFGETITPELANFDGSAPYGQSPKGLDRRKTIPVGSLGVANAFGLTDMHGNVWEWCADVWHDSYDGAPSDGSAWATGGDAAHHVLRGGSWFSAGHVCRAASREKAAANAAEDDFGFRVAVAL